MNVDQETGGIRPKGDKPPEIKIHGEKVKVLRRHEPFTYLGKPLTVAEEDEKQVPAMLKEYSEILEIKQTILYST